MRVGGSRWGLGGRRLVSIGGKISMIFEELRIFSLIGKRLEG
jgi:hypothetical protein